MPVVCSDFLKCSHVPLPCLIESVLPGDPQEHGSAGSHSLTRTAADSGCSVGDPTRVAVYPTKQFHVTLWTHSGWCLCLISA